MRAQALLFVALLLIYNLNLRQVSSHDTYASRFVPISVLRDGDLILDEFVPAEMKQRADRNLLSDNFVYVRGHFYDSHPPIGPLLTMPVYALPVWIGIPRDPELVGNLFSKLAASMMAALSAVMIFLGSKRLLVVLHGAVDSDRSHSDLARIALLAAIAYGLATSVWSTASLAIWTHTPAVLGFAVALWALTAGHPGLAGAALAAACFARPATAPVAALLGLYLMHRAWRHGWTSTAADSNRRDLWRFCAGVVVTGSMGVLYNYWLFGNLVGGAPFRTEVWFRELGTRSMFAGSLPAGLAGLTVSPSRGILIFSPVVLVAAYGAIRAWRSPLPPGRYPRTLAQTKRSAVRPSRCHPAHAIRKPCCGCDPPDLFEIHRLVGRAWLWPEVPHRRDAVCRVSLRTWTLAAVQRNDSCPHREDRGNHGSRVLNFHSDGWRFLLAITVDTQ